MTRINSHISPKRLTDEHLLAEHREIKRVTKFAQGVDKTKIPDTFRLGTGHVLFFVDKMQFLYNRYLSLHDECKNRGFDVQDYSQNFLNVTDPDLWNDWEGDEASDDLIKDRIGTRIKNSPKKLFHYYGKRITKQKAIDLLNG